MDRNRLSSACRLTENEEASLLREASSSRSRIAFDMASAARRADVRVQTDHLVFASRDDLILASTAVAGLDSIDLSKLEHGASVLFFYLSARESATIEPGFYTLRISGSPKEVRPGETTPGDAIPTSAWRGQLFDVNGNFAAALPVKVRESDTPRDNARVVLTLSVGEEGCVLDAHWRKLSIEIWISF
jgi:hypothetical protein